MDFITPITQQLSLQNWQVENVIKLIDDGNTLPFIARYRKEAHGSLNDQVLRELNERLAHLRNLDKRMTEIIGLITGQGAMTEGLMSSIMSAKTITELDDIYRPYRPKRKTRASVAKEKGLEALALKIFEQCENSPVPEVLAEKFVNAEKEVLNVEDALLGASDIIAELISDSARIRKCLRVVTMAQGIIKTMAVDENLDSVYTQYYDFYEPVSKIAGHRILAINRGEKEKFLKVSIDFEKKKAISAIFSLVIKQGNSKCRDIVKSAAIDAYERLIFPSIEREIRSELSERASEQAIKIFSVNLKNLLMQPPVKGKIAMGLDPGYRTGCKVAVVDKTGRVLDTTVVYPTHSEEIVSQAKKKISDLIKTQNVEVVAIGNGTASKETELFLCDVIKNIDKKVSYMVVSEAGASVYSASKLSAEEFPDLDLTLRSAISIARRLQDPLAELVKIDPKSIGVGQYQHDMPKKRLDDALGGVVEDCVNTVGIDINTASAQLLSYISGISKTVSKNIVMYREENGEFKSRAELKKVPKLGPKVFQQSAGFLRVQESNNFFDNTAVHPESYAAAKNLLNLCGYSLTCIRKNEIQDIKDKVDELGINHISEELGIGVPTLKDIISELLRPGRDPRDELVAPLLRTDVLNMEDLKEGMQLLGTVRNVIDFGIFVDIGVHQDGLVHVSQICDKFIKHPSEVVKVGDIVNVKIMSIDVPHKRISLTMKGLN